jgi:hypothetical protein
MWLLPYAASLAMRARRTRVECQRGWIECRAFVFLPILIAAALHAPRAPAQDAEPGTSDATAAVEPDSAEELTHLLLSLLRELQLHQDLRHAEEDLEWIRADAYRTNPKLRKYNDTLRQLAADDARIRNRLEPLVDAYFESPAVKAAGKKRAQYGELIWRYRHAMTPSYLAFPEVRNAYELMAADQDGRDWFINWMEQQGGRHLLSQFDMKGDPEQFMLGVEQYYREHAVQWREELERRLAATGYPDYVLELLAHDAQYTARKRACEDSIRAHKPIELKRAEERVQWFQNQLNRIHEDNVVLLERLVPEIDLADLESADDDLPLQGSAIATGIPVDVSGGATTSSAGGETRELAVDSFPGPRADVFPAPGRPAEAGDLESSEANVSADSAPGISAVLIIVALSAAALIVILLVVLRARAA